MKRQRISSLQVYRVVLSLVVLVALGLTACMAALPEEEPQTAAEPKVESESTFYAANPELMAVDRYTPVVADAAKTDSGFYAANPELMVISRHQNIEESIASANDVSYAANPELITADRYAAAQAEELRQQRILFPGR